ncbi:hypothetical protein PRIPAC_70952 [Pristionchus pacificus]|nr:hypothetical protein PRIPAC_70952 [Pristionchus pacificus]
MKYALGMENTLAARVNKCECGKIDNSPTIDHDVIPRERQNDEVGDGMINFFTQCSQRCESMEGVLNKKDCVNHLCSFVIPDQMENEKERYTTEIYITGNYGIDVYRLLDVPRTCREENKANERERQICLMVMVDFERLMAARGVARNWTLEGQSCKGKEHCPSLKRCDCIGMPYPTF